jgi:hypothetical protein
MTDLSFHNNDIYMGLGRALEQYERTFGHSVPASVIRSRLLGAAFEAAKWLEEGRPNPDWEERARWLSRQPHGTVAF